MQKTKRIILIDADLVSHFISAGEAENIHLVFPDNQIQILDKVYAELQRWKFKNAGVILSMILKEKNIQLIGFPEDNEAIKKEYFHIKKMMFKGDGESACLAVAKHNKNILASSNLRDIKVYCEMHKIDYLTTMDFLCYALYTDFFSLERCNVFIEKVLKSGSKLPVKKMEDFICKEINFL